MKVYVGCKPEGNIARLRYTQKMLNYDDEIKKKIRET